MSGGALDYAYQHVEAAARLVQQIGERGEDLTDAQRAKYVAFAAHIDLVAAALHDIEWVASADMGPGDEIAAIDACFTGTDAAREGGPK